MKRLVLILSFATLCACSDETVTKRVVTEQTRQEPVREVTVEKRLSPMTPDGVQVEEQIVRERTVPRTRYHRTDRETTETE